MVKDIVYTPEPSEVGDGASYMVISRTNSMTEESVRGKFTPPVSTFGEADDEVSEAIREAVKPHSDFLESSRQSSKNSKLPMLSLIISGIGLIVSVIGATHVQSLTNRIRELESSATTKSNITLHEIGSDESVLVLSAPPDVQADAQSGDPTQQKLEDILEIIKKMYDDKETGKAKVADTVTVTVTADPTQATTTDVQALSTPFNLQDEMWKVLFNRLSSP